MKVRVSIKPEARHELLRLVAARVADPGAALRLAVAYSDEIVRMFETHAAPPPGAVVRSHGGREMWWLFADGMWVAFTREDRSTGPRPFGRRERIFTVLAVRTRPGPSP